MLFSFFLFCSWLALCIAAGMFAAIRRNRSGLGWGAFAFFLSPALAFLFVAILLPLPPRARATSPQPDGSKTHFWPSWKHPGNGDVYPAR